MKNLIYLFILLACISCRKASNEPGKCHCPNFDFVLNPPYNDPVCHPSGSIIGFNLIPIKEIDYAYGYDCPLQANYVYAIDSLGFWLINSDGTNQKRVLPYLLQTPAWSPDGKWIAFSKDAQICIMPFDGQHFDTTAIVQLTTQGSNFSPEWSPDGKKIAFRESVCNQGITCGIWIYDFKTKSFEHIGKYGDFPSWSPISSSLIYATEATDKKGNDVGDYLWIYNMDTKETQQLKYLALPNYSNRYLHYSPSGMQIGFISALSTGGGSQLYTMNADGSNVRQLTTGGCLSYSWLPDGKIVYQNFDYSRIDSGKGALWIMDADGTNKHQLTYNRFKIVINSNF